MTAAEIPSTRRRSPRWKVDSKINTTGKPLDTKNNTIVPKTNRYSSQSIRYPKRKKIKSDNDVVITNKTMATKQCRTTSEHQSPTQTNLKQTSKTTKPSSSSHRGTLPRTIENATRQMYSLDTCCSNSGSSGLEFVHVFGIDEAGRGPLAGPVVVAAVGVLAPSLQPLVSSNKNNSHGTTSIVSMISGITDSKKITSEAQRECLYEQIIQMNSNDTSEETLWAIAVIDSTKIDEINILQATMLGMRLVTEALIGYHTNKDSNNICTSLSINNESFPIYDKACVTHKGCYVVQSPSCGTNRSTVSYHHNALIDGNRIPNDMPCFAVAIIGGDGREYCIAAASIVAKVTRDRLMKEWDHVYPQYDSFASHKGYPTLAHRTALRKYGPCPLHRMTFAPVKESCKKKRNQLIITDNNTNGTGCPRTSRKRTK